MHTLWEGWPVSSRESPCPPLGGALPPSNPSDSTLPQPLCIPQPRQQLLKSLPLPPPRTILERG